MPPVEAHEAQPLGVEVELDFAYWAITVLGDDEVGDVLELGVIWLVVAWPVNKGDDVGVLLNRARFTQVGQLWHWRGARLHRAAQLT